MIARSSIGDHRNARVIAAEQGEPGFDGQPEHGMRDEHALARVVTVKQDQSTQPIWVSFVKPRAALGDEGEHGSRTGEGQVRCVIADLAKRIQGQLARFYFIGFSCTARAFKRGCGAGVMVDIDQDAGVFVNQHFGLPSPFFGFGRTVNRQVLRLDYINQSNLIDRAPAMAIAA